MGLLKGRRKSSSNVLEEVEFPTSPVAQSPAGDSGGFRLMSRDEVSKANERKKQEKPASKFPRFSGFGGAGNKARNHSFDEDSPASSKRDSKSSNGTQFSSSRPYNNGQYGQYGSTSTLPSSAESDPNDNIFANVPRPQMPQQHSSSGSFSMSNVRKQLPAIPKTSPKSSLYDTTTSSSATGRDRAMTSSSYASTAIPPKLETDLNFGSSSFDDLFSGLQRKESPEMPQAPGRSLLADKRTFQAEPLKIDRKLEVDAPLKSWDSRGSADNLMSSPRSDNDSPPPPVPPHKYSSKQKYAPIASHSPELPSSSGFEDTDAKVVRQSFMSRKPANDSSSEQEPKSISSSSANSLQTPLSSRTGSNITTPKPALRPGASPNAEDDDDADKDDNLFAPPKVDVPIVKKPTLPALSENKPLAIPSTGESSRRVMTQAEFRAYQQRQMSQPLTDESSDEEDYEDEEDIIKKRQEEEVMRRKNQQMSFAREAMRRTTTAPPATTNRPESFVDGFGMGFPSETSMKADEWEDEDVPLGILAQHGFPNTARNRLPSQPSNAMPSYFRTSTPTVPDRPASAGAVSNRASQAYKPVFARHLPDDPHASFIGSGLVRPSNRESLGFSRGPASVAGDAMGNPMGNPMMYQEPQLSQPSLVDQIQMRDMTRQKYMGGASTKKAPQGGPFTGLLGQHMNQSGQPNQPNRMSTMGMPSMNGMNGMNGMNPMMGMMGGMNPMMGMNHMGYPMVQSNDSMMQMQQMQQMLAMQQMQLQQQAQQMQAFSQDPRMSMMDPNNRMSMMDPQRMSMMMPNNMGFQNNSTTNLGGSFLNVPGGAQRPMSVFSMGGGQSYQPQQRPLSTPALNQPNGYTPSIAPSERSNIGLSARYRPVATGHNQDAVSTHSSMTLQASNGASQNKPGIVKGILKNKSPQITVHEEDDENWSKLAARKNKFAKGGKSDENGLEELARAVDGF